MKYLQRYQIQELKEFCKKKIFNIVSTIENKNKKEYRGRYKGYIYGIKLCSYFLSKKNYPSHRELYTHIKIQNTVIYNNFHEDTEYIEGIKFSIYDILGFLSEIKNT